MIQEDTPRLKRKKEIYFKIVQASDAHTSAQLDKNFFKEFVAYRVLVWHNFRSIFTDMRNHEAFSAMYIGQDRAHQRKGLT